MRGYMLFIFIYLAIENNECASCSWLPDNVANVFVNKTTQITEFIRQRSKALKDFYVHNVKDKMKSLLGYGGNGNEIENREEKEENSDRAQIKFPLEKHVCKHCKDKGNYDLDAIKLYTWYIENDPAIHMSTPQLIASNGYPGESHAIVTDDGYILTVHRMPYTKHKSNRVVPRKTVLLHHGLLSSSADWVIAGPEKSLAYILSDAGYDVWMANARGNTYSRSHVSKPVDSFDFWNFTFHEIGHHDLPAVIDYIMQTKGWDVKINYIGHSMGTTVLFALLSTKPQYNKILRAGFALAPVAYMSEVKSPLRLFAKFSNNIEYLFKILGANEFLPHSTIVKWLSKLLCEETHIEEVLCENSLFVICGHDEKEFNRTLLPRLLGHVPAGASTKTIIHYSQEIRTGKFQQFDYGVSGNMEQYGLPEPPEYPVHAITLPIALLSAENDWLSSDIDVTNLYAQLANPIEHYVVPMKEFNHVDFLWGIDAPKLVYKKLLKLLEDGVSESTHRTEVDEVFLINE